jgi:uncharacterized protein (TIGR02284 family)
LDLAYIKLHKRFTETGEFMADIKDDQISILNDLIETCKDGESGFHEAAEGTNDPQLKALFEKYSTRRREFARELQAEVRRLGGDPDNSGSVAGSLHRGWMNMKTAVTGKDDSAIISEAERGEDSAVKNYERALNQNLSADLEQIVRRQYSEVKSIHDRIRSLELAKSGKS